MSDVNQQSVGQQADQQAKTHGGLRFGLDEYVLAALALLSLAGLGLTNALINSSHWWWLLMVGVYGVCLTFLSWRRLGEGERGHMFLIRSALQWLGLYVAIQLLYLFVGAGKLTNEGTGLVALLLFALTIFLVGVRGNPKLCMLGVLFALILVATALYEQYLTMLLTIGGVLVLMYFGVRYLAWRFSRKHTTA